MGLHVSGTVMAAEIQGSVVILDLKTQAYHILNPVGTSMWNALVSEEDAAHALQVLQNRYSAEPTRIQADLEAFRRNCLEMGFLQKDKPAPIPPSGVRVEAWRRGFLAMRAWWSLFRTGRSLSAKGFSWTYQDYARIPIPKEAEDSDLVLKRALSAFRTAENFFLSKRAPSDCVPRSLALFRFLRSAGLEVEHRIGVRRFPFQAHAWVEHHGRVVLDNPARRTVYGRLASIPP
jgi:hypothetical protein